MDRLPLCVDCDGTLVKTDLFFEAMLQLAKKNLAYVFLLPLWMLKGKAHLKTEVAKRITVAPDCLPYNASFLEYLRQERATGRFIALVTGAPIQFADAVASYLGLFSEVHATTQQCNLTGVRKRDMLCRRFGERQYDYAANESADLAIWQSAAAAIVVNAPDQLTRSAAKITSVAKVFPRQTIGLKTYLRALRVHQWLKNLLIFVPLAVAHQLGDLESLLFAVFAFFAFSLCASAVYIVNDLLDLPSDRLHPRKRFRPFAAGELSVLQGLMMAAGCVTAAISLCTLLPPLFLYTIGAYLIATTAYSFVMKNRAIVDVILLAALYTVRIIAGSAAVGIFPSFWLLAFAMFLFLSLAVVKRYAELLVMVGDGKKNLHGRGYVTGDLPLLLALGMSSGVIAVLVLALYINSPEVGRLYQSLELLWLIPPLMLYWISRVWFKTHRGEMHDDPIVFAASDLQSLGTGVCLIGLSTLAAYYNG